LIINDPNSNPALVAKLKEKYPDQTSEYSNYQQHYKDYFTPGHGDCCVSTVDGSVDHRKLATNLRRDFVGGMKPEEQAAMDRELNRMTAKGDLNNQQTAIDVEIKNDEILDAQWGEMKANFNMEFEKFKKIAPAVLIPLGIALGIGFGGGAYAFAALGLKGALVGGLVGSALMFPPGFLAGTGVGMITNAALESRKPWLGGFNKGFRDKRLEYSKARKKTGEKEAEMLDVEAKFDGNQLKMKEAMARIGGLLAGIKLDMSDPTKIADQLIKDLGIDKLKLLNTQLTAISNSAFA
jgi:hypothetical protein